MFKTCLLLATLSKMVQGLESGAWIPVPAHTSFSVALGTLSLSGAQFLHPRYGVMAAPSSRGDHEDDRSW